MQDPFLPFNFDSATLRGELQRYFRSLVLLVILPAVPCVGFIIWLAGSVGALMSPQVFADAQFKDHGLVVSLRSIKDYGAYKLARIAQEQPDVVFIGASRCSEFRSAMLKPLRAYNGCVSAWSIDQNVDLLRRILTAGNPKIVIFCLDYFMFTEAYEEGTKERSMRYGPNSGLQLDGVLDVLTAIRERPWETIGEIPTYLSRDAFEPVDHLRMLGLNGMRLGAGFRYDGSVLFPRGQLDEAHIVTQKVGYGLLTAIPGGPQVDPRQIDALRALSDIARQRNITLVGIQLPIQRSSVDFLDTDQGYWQYSGVWREFETERMRTVFSNLGIHFFDLSRDLEITADSRYFVDAIHVGEAGMLGGLVHLFDNPDFRMIFRGVDGNAMRDTYNRALEAGDFFHVYHAQF